MSEEKGRKNLRMPNDDEMFAIVTRHDGGNHVRVECEDGENRMGRIPGRMKYRNWINEGDVVLVEPWDWQDEKANIEWSYSDEDADQLRREGHVDAATF
jgi:translation initiation factor 1A